MDESKMSENERLLRINIIVLLIGGICYSIIYFVGGSIALGLGILLSTSFMTLVVYVCKKKLGEEIATYFLTFVQYAIIVLFGLLGGEFAGGFSLIVGVIAMNSTYFIKKIVVIQWALTDVILLISLFFRDSLYAGLGTAFLVRSFLGINFCLFFLWLLLNWILKFKNESLEKEKTTLELVDQVEVKMKEQEDSAHKIQSIFEGIKSSSNNLKSTSDQMLDIASILNGNANNQTSIIADLVSKSRAMEEEIYSTKQMAVDSSKIVGDNAEILAKSNENMTEAVKTIAEMEDSSRKINTIIKQIEDIAFQTNILALNAAIEAARAGAAGKGFAVVAEEVQTLATKSSEAANASSILINNSIANVQTGARFIREAAKNMDEVIESSNHSAEKVSDINVIIEKQVHTVGEIIVQMNNFMDIITQTSQTAEQSNVIASDISEQITQINAAIRSS